MAEKNGQDSRVGKLEAELTKMRDDLKKQKVEAAQQFAALRQAAELEIERLKTGRGGIGTITPQSVLNAEKRALMKEETLHEGEGENEVALYRIPDGGESFYRKSVTVLPGSIVRLTVAEDPSVTWEVVVEKGKAKSFTEEDLEPSTMSSINEKAAAAAEKRMADMTKI